jgi:hypothetical protein
MAVTRGKTIWKLIPKLLQQRNPKVSSYQRQAMQIRKRFSVLSSEKTKSFIRDNDNDNETNGLLGD